jgi:hypothetical protein
LPGGRFAQQRIIGARFSFVESASRNSGRFFDLRQSTEIVCLHTEHRIELAPKIFQSNDSR